MVKTGALFGVGVGGWIHADTHSVEHIHAFKQNHLNR